MIMAERKIMKIAVTQSAKQVVAGWSREMDMTEQGVASRIYEWFGTQDEVVQRGILGMFGDRAPDIARMVLEDMAQRDSRDRLRSGTIEAGQSGFEGQAAPKKKKQRAPRRKTHRKQSPPGNSENQQ